MQAHAIQELFDELKASCPDDLDSDSSRPDAILAQEPSVELREIALLLEIAAQAYRRPMRPARPINPSTLTAKACFDLPPPVKYSRKNKGGAVPLRREH